MTTHRPTVLVVDDEPELLHSVHDLLRLEYRVLTRETGAEAIEVLDSNEPINVIISDQRMPGMSGVDVLRHARRVRPEATRLMLTAYADIKAVIDAVNQGSLFRYLSKPWDADELQSVVKQAVEQNALVLERDRLIDELKASNLRLAEADRLKGAFIEVAGHELNTPVAVILGMAQLWKMTQEQTATPSERHWVDRIFSAGKRLASTVERMLKLVRSDDLSRPFDFRRIALDSLIREVVGEMSPFLIVRRQLVDLDLDPTLGEAVVDSSKIGDVFANLLINAIKFTPDGGTIRVSGTADGIDHVRVVVADQGMGIDPTLRPFLFQPFFTGFDTMHHSSGEFEYGKRGIGLGLCLVKRFVELHGGSVDVLSTPGVGSTFVVTLPRHPPSSLSLSVYTG